MLKLMFLTWLKLLGLKKHEWDARTAGVPPRSPRLSHSENWSPSVIRWYQKPLRSPFSAFGFPKREPPKIPFQSGVCPNC